MATSTPPQRNGSWHGGHQVGVSEISCSKSRHVGGGRRSIDGERVRVAKHLAMSMHVTVRQCQSAYSYALRVLQQVARLRVKVVSKAPVFQVKNVPQFPE